MMGQTSSVSKNFIPGRSLQQIQSQGVRCDIHTDLDITEGIDRVTNTSVSESHVEVHTCSCIVRLCHSAVVVSNKHTLNNRAAAAVITGRISAEDASCCALHFHDTPCP